MAAQKSPVIELFINPMFQNYTMKNGLLSNFTTDVVQDRKGYIWVSSGNGLIKYSGSSFTNFQQQSTNINYRLISNHVIDLYAEPEGDVWINTNVGLCKYDIKKDKIINFKQKSIGWGRVYVSKNKVYISQYLGIEEYYLKNDSLIFNTYYENTKYNSIFNITELNNSIWACAEDNPSLIKIFNGKSDFIKLYFNKELLIIKTICKYNNKELLIGTENNGIFLFNTENNALTFLKNNNLKSISSIAKYSLEGQEFILIGTKKQSLFIYNYTQNSELINIKPEFGKPQGILSIQIESFLIDKHNGIWIAGDKGISYFHPSTQKTKVHFIGSNGFDNISINTISPIDNFSFLVGSENFGLLLYNSISNSKEIISSKELIINKLCKINDKEFLIGCENGIYTFNQTNKKLEHLLPSIFKNKQFLNIVKLSDSLFGLCTQNGAYIYNFYSKKITFQEATVNATPQNKKYCKDLLLIDNKLWILRYFNGIDIYDFKSKKYETITPEILINKPIDFYNLSKSISDVYISSTLGIIKINIKNNQKYSLITNKDNLDGDNVQNVIFSLSDQKLYYSNLSAIYHYDELKKKSTLLFSYENYPQKWFNQFYKTNDNNFFTTVSDYFIQFKQPFTYKNESIPNCSISYIYINNKQSILSSNNLKLNYTQNNIAIKMDALCYPDADKNTWFYSINSKKWESTKSGQINLFNLTPGKYNILVYSENNEGEKSNIKNLISFTISHPFYNTWWFYLFVSLFGLLIVFIFYQYKKKQLERLQSIRNQISRDLHDELGANISAIHIMSDLLSKKGDLNPQNKTIADKISSYSIEVSNTINDIIWNINPKFDTIDELIKKMMVYAINILESSEIPIEIKTPSEFEDFKIKSKVKYNLYLIFKEAINNAAKYSKSKKITINFESKNQIFIFEIRDYGVGFNLSSQNSRNGLTNIKTRALEINANVEINSKLGEGTTIKLNYKTK